MARLTDKTSLSVIAEDDLIHVVDVSDTAGSGEGTSKKIKKVDLIASDSIKYIGQYNDSLTTAISSIGTNEVTLVIDKTVTLTANDTVPENITLEKTRAGLFTGAFTLTINGGMTGDLLTQWFDSSVTVKGNPKTKSIYPEMFGAKGDGVADDTASIVAAIAFVSPQGVIDNQLVFFNDSKDLHFGPFNYLISSQITVPNHVDLVGSGAKNTVFTTSGTDAGFIFQGYGGCSRNFTIHGSNEVTTQLFYGDTPVGRTFTDIQLEWSLGDGAVLDNVQNCTFNQFNIASCGNTDTVTGALLRFVDTTYLGSSNVFLRCEFAAPAAYGIYFEQTQQGSGNKNMFIDCIVEYWKGKWAGAYYGAPITSTVLAMVYIDGGDWGHPAFEFLNSNITKYGHDTATPLLDLRRGATITLQNTQVQGDAAYTAVGIKITSATDITSVYIQDLAYTIIECAIAFDTYGTNFVIKSYGKSYFGNNTSKFASDSGLTYEDAVSLDTKARLVIGSGQISFPATQNPSGDANTLDDYQEGIFTPTLLSNGVSTGITMTNAQGYYRKIGGLIFASIYVTANVSSPSAGDVTIGGLPGTTRSAYPGTLAMGSYYGVPAGTVINAQVDGGETGVISLYAPNNGAAQAGNANLNGTDLLAHVGFTLSGCYLAL